VGRGKVEIQIQDSHFPTAPTACGARKKARTVAKSESRLHKTLDTANAVSFRRDESFERRSSIELLYLALRNTVMNHGNLNFPRQRCSFGRVPDKNCANHTRSHLLRPAREIFHLLPSVLKRIRPTNHLQAGHTGLVRTPLLTKQNPSKTHHPPAV
jgi:hypothetical protein